MAVIKHIASKNADYGESERYLIFQHNEYTQKPILDDEGHMILRDEYYLDSLNCDPGVSQIVINLRVDNMLLQISSSKINSFQKGVWKSKLPYAFLYSALQIV